MEEVRFAELAQWITSAGLAGQSETAMMTGFCERAVVAGLPLASGLVIIDTLHPVYEGRVVRWFSAEEKQTEFIEYGRKNEGETAAIWRASPFYRLLESGE